MTSWVLFQDALTNTKDPEVEKQNRRTTHVLSSPVFVRTRAPCEPPVPIVTGTYVHTGETDERETDGFLVGFV